MIDRRQVQEIDWILIGLVLLQTLIGIVFIYSASHLAPGHFFVRQILWVAAGLVALFLVILVDYKFLVSFSPYFYIGIVLVLFGTLAFTRLVAGTKSWITFGMFQAQPSELAKVVMVLVFARLFAEYKKSYVSPRFAGLALLVAGVPLVLIVLQPDLGTAVTFLAIIGGAFALAGMKKKTIVVFLLAALAIGLAGWNFGLREYQKKRLTTLLDPHQDPRGSGYQIIQSKIAIGSGGLTGRGFMKGLQSKYRFLPARHTDFIFSVIGEEFGFLGVFAVIVLYSLMLSRMFLTVSKARDRSGVYIVFMSSLLIAFQFLINILMIIGLFPVTGVPLPFLSYGGSSLLAGFLTVGLIVNVRMRRFANV